jgi:hypothetical protein
MNAIDKMWKSSLLVAALIAGCGCASNGNGAAADMALDPCNRGTLESDLMPTPFMGPGVDASGNIKPGQYIVSSTYLRFKPGANAEFMQLVGPIKTSLATTSGLVAARFGLAATCNSGRTLTVWADQESMMKFVVSPAHSAASAKVTDLSRGGGAVVDFADDGSGATFARVVSELAKVPPQF